MSSFAHLRSALREWPKTSPESDTLPELPYERLRMALPTATGSADLACLIRQALRREVVFFERETSLTVPAQSPFPERAQWLLHGCKVRPVPGNAFEIEALPWNPPWLKRMCVREEEAPPFQEVEKDRLRSATDRKVRSDPALLSQFRLTHYLSSAQAETIRSVLLSPAGSVQLVVLPTGGGKSLVGIGAGLLGPNEAGLSLFVVPTIALAHDQVKSARVLRPNDAIDAWEGGLSQEDRAAIHERMRSGTQRLLFASPESIVGSLAKSLIELAERGALRAFVVDEAHLVSQWGASFRPEYQLMGAFWRYLRECCPENRPFRTLLMTATLTEETYADLDLFFGPIGPQNTLATVVLRQEPDYFQACCASEEEKIERIIEVLRHGPRPAILYVTEVDDARAWHERCLKLRWLRTGLIHGKTSSADREKAITNWRENKLDLMVATSAFGLGMDKGEVRLVLHACVPETVDRFYQEVGRGGRDGKASVSITIWTEKNFQVAEGMSSPKLISSELGLDRWVNMWTKRKRENELFLIDTRSVRAGLSYDGDRNADWNVRTLLLLVRAGVLRISYLPFQEPVQLHEETDEQFKDRNRQVRKEYLATFPVELLGNNNPSDQKTWEELVESHRKHSLRQGEKSWRRMADLLKKEALLTATLQTIYRIPAIGIHSVGLDFDDAMSTPPIRPCDEIKPALALAVAGQPRIPLIIYDPAKLREHGRLIVETLKRLATLGVREFAVPQDWIGAEKWLKGSPNPLDKLRQLSPEKFVIVRDIEEQDPVFQGRLAVPRISLIDYSNIVKPIPDHLLVLDRPLHLILVPEGTPDRESPWRKVEEAPHLRLENFHRLLAQ